MVPHGPPTVGEVVVVVLTGGGSVTVVVGATTVVAGAAAGRELPSPRTQLVQAEVNTRRTIPA